MQLKALKGVNDILPKEIKQWDYLEDKAKLLFSVYGYQQIRIPIIEESKLFSRSIGQETDIVEKEMYSFVDRGKRNIALRPEATASVVRAYLEHHFDQQGLSKLFYIGPMFRGEKPQSGRNRQFYQIGIEALGSDNPYLDAEIINISVEYLNALGLKHFKLVINTVGCKQDKLKFSQALKADLKDKKNDLCQSCQKRFERNVLRVLDCKNKTCRKIIQASPKTINHLCPSCAEHFQQVKNALDLLKVHYTEDPFLVRGLDYYTKTVFEITHKDLGAQNAVCAGGRYDNLIPELGGPAKGATGFAFGVERLLLAAQAEGIKFPCLKQTTVYTIALGEAAYKKILEIANILRQNKIATHVNYEPRSLKAQMRQASKLHCDYVLILGDNEFKNNCIILRDMNEATQESVKLNNITGELKRKINVHREKEK